MIEDSIVPEVTRPLVSRTPLCLDQDCSLYDQKVGPNSGQWSITYHLQSLYPPWAKQHTCMCQAECPQPQVRRSVGDAAKAVLDGVDGLCHQDLPKVKLRDNREH